MGNRLGLSPHALSPRAANARTSSRTAHCGGESIDGRGVAARSITAADAQAVARAARDRRSRAAVAVLLEDRAQPLERARQPRFIARAGRATRGKCRTAASGKCGPWTRRACRSRRRVELEQHEQADAVELAHPSREHDLAPGVDLDDRQSPHGKRANGSFGPEPTAGAEAIGLLPGHPPVLEEVVGELGVVGDVQQVLEDLAARAGDGRLEAEGSTARESMAARGPALLRRAIRRTLSPCS